MCPACIATAALIAASATSGGGLAALALKKLRRPTGAEEPDPATRQLDAERDE